MIENEFFCICIKNKILKNKFLYKLLVKISKYSIWFKEFLRILGLNIKCFWNHLDNRPDYSGQSLLGKTLNSDLFSFNIKTFS